ncbi:hypothetical protein [Dermatobacter hominis]|uniref:hypothetical protein n=1 Tax=Dermatobacter hominis TaxID=2884263 RepID=UPI001D0F938F|nr:hypothetical protein [Dermatobacter hominis]UDY34923.1 hypothetical protein LH044_16490 [Dermatobacter hominis]
MTAARAGRHAVGVAAAAGAAAVVALAVVWGARLLDDGAELFLSAPPFAGEWVWRWPAGLWVAVLLAIAIAVWWPVAVERLPWRAVLVASAAVSFVWTAVLAASGGIDGLSAPLVTRFEYLPYAREAPPPGELLSQWSVLLPDAPTHVQGHPPGSLLVFMGLDRLGIGDLSVAIIVLLAGASAAAASLVALDRLAGRAAARRAAAFAGLAPAVVWAGTSVDGMAMGVTAWAVAAGAAAATADDRTVAAGAGAVAGLLAAALLTMTYGAPTLLGPLWALAVWTALRRRPWPIVAASAGLLVPVGALALPGFDWAAGFSATHDAYRAGVAAVRPGGYFLVANLAAVTVAAGPATVAGAAVLRDRRAWLLVGGALAGVVIADVSGLSKGEVERIWLPLVPFLVIASCSLRGRVARRGWLAAQLAIGVVLQAWLRSPW